MSEKVVVKYYTRKHYCNCCNQKLESPITSDTREFKISKDTVLGWCGDWKEIIEYEDDLNEVVREMVYDTISFFATNSYDKLIISNEEIEKVKYFILREVTE